jgi:hypothetical protein
MSKSVAPRTVDPDPAHLDREPSPLPTVERARSTVEGIPPTSAPRGGSRGGLGCRTARRSSKSNVSAAAVGELMYPHIEQAVEVYGEEAEQFLTEGPDIVPSMVPRLSAALPGIAIRSCFLGSVSFSGNDLGSYRAETAARGRPPRRA